jgi:hypothetical protein
LNKLAISPSQGNLLAVAHHDGLIELRNTDTGEEVTPLIRHTDETLRMRSSGGRHLSVCCLLESPAGITPRSRPALHVAAFLADMAATGRPTPRLIPGR